MNSMTRTRTGAEYRWALAMMACMAALIPSTVNAQSTPAADRPPSGLQELAGYAKSLFDAAYASDWRSASEQMHAMSDTASVLPLDLPKPDIVGRLKAAVQYAGDGTSAHDRFETMDEANTITRLTAGLSAEFQSQVPYEARMLGYYGRELELGLVASRPSLLAQTVDELQSAWTRLEPTMERRGHVDEAKRFTDIVVQLIGAERPAQYVSPTRAELAEAERIEQLLARP
jgi:hypothetical protein